MTKDNVEIPVQPVDKPILCNPYDEPDQHWKYDKETGEPRREQSRRPAGYYYKTSQTGSSQRDLFAEEEWDDLPLVNYLRDDVKKWRESGYRGSTRITRDLLNYWKSPDRPRRLFFCQKEAVETIIYLLELRITGRSSRTGFKKFNVTQEDLNALLQGIKPRFEIASSDVYPKLIDEPSDQNLMPLRRLGCKMATGSGKTVVMAMLIAWAFCNRGQNPNNSEFPNAALVCCPNITIYERLQVLRPDHSENYYNQFDLVPVKYRPLIQNGKVLIVNWHKFAPESEHKEGDKTYVVVDKGPETAEVFTKRVLGDLYDHLPIMVLNDEGHHAWRPKPIDSTRFSSSERKELEQEVREATVWIDGLDKINNANENNAGILACIDLSATPFYIKGSGYSEGRPFPWLISDFGLVDAIESGIVKIPRLPVSDTTGRPDPKYFKLWAQIKSQLQPAEILPGGRPKPDVVYRETEGALQQIAGQWVERYQYLNEATPEQEQVPPVLIIVCDNTDIAEVFYNKISGETVEDVVSQHDLDQLLFEQENDVESSTKKKSKKTKTKKKTVYGQGSVYPEYFANTATETRTIRIDSKLLAEAESEDPSKGKKDFAEQLRKVVATVGKQGQEGESVRCVVSVSMLTEGWDANNVTHVLGVRAFGSQLLCEQVVGRGLRRMDYTPDPSTGFLTEEYVDVYGIPFSVIPFKGRPVRKPEPEDRPKNHVKASPERSSMEIRFPVVEGYVFALKKNLIKCNIDTIENLILEPCSEPTATFVSPTIGYRDTPNATHPEPIWKEQNRETYYEQTHIQTIQFQIAKLIVDQLSIYNQNDSDLKNKVLKLQSRHQLFPQVYSILQNYIQDKVELRGCHPCELGLEKYVTRIVERLRDAIEPDDFGGEAPLLPILNRYKPIGSTADVNFITARPCCATLSSHINQVVLDTSTWESSAAFYLESAAQKGLVKFYARNDHLGLMIPYTYQGVDHHYEPDFLVRLKDPATEFDRTVVLEIKGYEDDIVKAKHNAAKRWVSAVNNWGQLGKWYFHVCRDPQLLTKELENLYST